MFTRFPNYSKNDLINMLNKTHCCQNSIQLFRNTEFTDLKDFIIKSETDLLEGLTLQGYFFFFIKYQYLYNDKINLPELEEIIVRLIEKYNLNFERVENSYWYHIVKEFKDITDLVEKKLESREDLIEYISFFFEV